MADKEKFKHRAASWSIVIKDGDVIIKHDGFNHSVHHDGNIGAIAEEMAGIVKFSVLAMPKNGAKVIRLNCSWE